MISKSLDHDSSLPKYLQLQDILVRQIQSDAYQVGDKLCTDKKLKARYRLSTSTVCRALSELERSGLVIRKPGAGTFVKSKAINNPQAAPDTPLRHTLLICGVAPAVEQTLDNVNWFIRHEIYRGLINSFFGRSRIVLLPELFAEIESIPTGEQFGVVITNLSPDIEDQLRKRNVSYMAIDQERKYARLHANTIGFDPLRGVYNAMSCLIEELGHRNVAFIGPDQAKLSSSHRDRWAGYALGLQAYNLPVRDELVVLAAAGTVNGGYDAARQLLQRRVAFTAVFVDTDIKAIGAIQALHEAGLRVPEQVSVLGFDDVPGMDRTDPPLTTVRMPYYEAGVEAVRLLDSKPDADGNRPGRILEARLIVRKSCASLASQL